VLEEILNREVAIGLLLWTEGKPSGVFVVTQRRDIFY
jgi:hypothetical protein